MKNKLKNASKKKYILWLIEIIIILLSVLIVSSIKWMFKTWNNLNIEELIYQIKAPIQGTSTEVLMDYINSCVTFVILVMIGLVVIICGKRVLSRFDFVMGGITIVALIMAGNSMYYAWDRLEVGKYLNNQSVYSTFIDDNYINPNSVNIEFPENKRNLIYIFLESMETTYADKKSGGGFEENVIPELTELSIQNESFSGNESIINGGYSLTGTTWTVGAMFGQTSGLPLNLPIGNDEMYTQEEFFPNITTLGDILDREGYEQALLLGSYALFSGRDLYFKTHGNYDIYDYAYSVNSGEIPEDYYVWWGYEDKKLFENAKMRLTELASTNKPFNFTMLTADTHFEDGYLCEDCENKYDDNQYANVFACSSAKVAELINWIQQQDFYDNTTIVISGDHLTMDSDFCQDIDENYLRKVYTTYINAVSTPIDDKKREYSTFDNFPTTLAALGAKIEGNRLGLGTNLFSDELTLTEKYGYKTENEEISKKSMLMEEITSYIDIERRDAIKDKENDVQNNSVNISVSDYNYEEGRFNVEVSQLDIYPDIQKVVAAVYPEGKTDVLWYESTMQADGSCVFSVWASDNAYENMKCKIEVYVIDNGGNSFFVGETAGNIGDVSDK